VKLGPAIARARLYDSILVIPRRKTSLVEAFQQRLPWPSSSSMASNGEELPKEGLGAVLLTSVVAAAD
jgi:hypothetical protein